MTNPISRNINYQNYCLLSISCVVKGFIVVENRPGEVDNKDDLFYSRCEDNTMTDIATLETNAPDIVITDEGAHHRS